METVQVGRCEGKGGGHGDSAGGKDSDMRTYVDLICSDLNLCRL